MILFLYHIFSVKYTLSVLILLTVKKQKNKMQSAEQRILSQENL